MNCRPGCAACCIAPSISTPVPSPAFGSAAGARATPKPAGTPCPQLLPDLRCALFGLPQRPAVCSSLRPTAEMCGDSREHAMRWLTALECDTQPLVASSKSPPASAALSI